MTKTMTNTFRERVCPDSGQGVRRTASAGEGDEGGSQVQGKPVEFVEWSSRHL